jgi:hypothetical protein
MMRNIIPFFIEWGFDWNNRFNIGWIFSSTVIRNLELLFLLV